MTLHALDLWKIDETLFFNCANLQDFYFDKDLLQLGIAFSNNNCKFNLFLTKFGTVLIFI